MGCRLGWQEEKERERRSSTAGLKTYVTVGSQRAEVGEEAGTTAEYKFCHVKVISSYLSFDNVAGVWITRYPVAL